MDHGNIFVEGVICPLILLVVQGAEDCALVWVLDVGSSGALPLPLLDELRDVFAQLVLVLVDNLQVVVAEILAALSNRPAGTLTCSDQTAGSGRSSLNWQSVDKPRFFASHLEQNI